MALLLDVTGTTPAYNEGLRATSRWNLYAMSAAFLAVGQLIQNGHADCTEFVRTTSHWHAVRERHVQPSRERSKEAIRP